MGITVGIDLGTTNSAIARIDENGKPIIIPNSEGNKITPSVICFRDQEILIGDPAKELQALAVYPIAAFFKRQIGDPNFLFNANDHDYTAIDLSTLILKKIKTDAEAYIGEEITDAVITTPAYFKERERKATEMAGKAAGLNVLSIINEPTAAAVAYRLSNEKDGQLFLVYDLGGGTFDITLVKLTQEGIQTLSSEGDHQLGGKDWDDRIVQFLANQFQDEFGVDPLDNSESLADLLLQAEEAKKRLTAFNSTTVSLVFDRCRGKYQFDRSKFEEITADLMERTFLLINRVIENLQLEKQNIAGVLLVGGATRMPMVSNLIKNVFGLEPLDGINVDEAVALGAAIYAANQTVYKTGKSSQLGLPGLPKIVDVTNHSLGMIAVNSDRSAYLNSIILSKNKEIPCIDRRPYQYLTRRNRDNFLEIFMTQGESINPQDAYYLGKYIIRNIPHQQSAITVINISYSYNSSGMVEVTAQLKNSTKMLEVEVEKLPLDIPDRFLGTPDLNRAETLDHITAYLAFDLSGSMRGKPLLKAKEAAMSFLLNTDLSHCSLGIIAFSNKVNTKLVACQNARDIEYAINNLQVGETGYGNLAHPFNECFTLLNKLPNRKFIITLADGVWTNQKRAVTSAQKCHKADINIIAIGFGSADKLFLRAIASSNEASFFTTLNDLEETFSSIAQELTETGGLSLTNKG